MSETHEPKKMDDLVNGTREKAGMKIIRLETGCAAGDVCGAQAQRGVTILVRQAGARTGCAGAVLRRDSLGARRPGGHRPQDGRADHRGLLCPAARDKTFMGAVEPPIEYQSLLTGDKERDIQMITQQIVSYMEGVIRRNPNQWYMFREMWPRTESHDAEVRQKRFWGGKTHIEMVKG